MLVPQQTGNQSVNPGLITLYQMAVGVRVPLSSPPDPVSFFIGNTHSGKTLSPYSATLHFWLDESGFPFCLPGERFDIRNHPCYVLDMNSQLPMALHIMGFLASCGGDALTSEVLAATYGTSPVVLRRVLAKLKRAGLVQTQRGVGGGSVLARDAGSITLREVYEAIADEMKLMPPFSGHCCGPVAPVLASYVNELFAEAEQALLAKLEAVTVAKMDEEVRQRVGAAAGCRRNA